MYCCCYLYVAALSLLPGTPTRANGPCLWLGLPAMRLLRCTAVSGSVLFLLPMAWLALQWLLRAEALHVHYPFPHCIALYANGAGDGLMGVVFDIPLMRLNV